LERRSGNGLTMQVDHRRVTQATRVVAFYDIHGNRPALDAVLSEVELITPDLVLVSFSAPS
jgi:hypothetical protein